MVIAVVAPIALMLAGTLTYAPLVLLAPARLSAPVPTWCVVENVPVPVPAVVSAPWWGAPAAVDESSAAIPLLSSNLYQRTTSPSGPPPAPPPPAPPRPV